MLKCPFCGFDNEDGALFCEQCKSDLSSVPSTPAPAPADVPMAAIPIADVPMAEIPVAEVPMAAVAVAEVADVPMAAMFGDPAMLEKTAPIPVVGSPIEAMPVEAFPVLADTLPMAAIEAMPVLGLDAPVAEAIPAVVVPEPAPAPPPPPPAPTPVAAPVAAAPAPAAPPAAAPASAGIPSGAQPRLKVMRGLKVGVEFPIYGDYNYIGRADDKPVDIDLEDQEPPDRVWCSRQHAVIHFDEAAGVITLEDLNSSNGTYVNRTRVYPGEKKSLNPNDVVQIGTVHMKLLV